MTVPPGAPALQPAGSALDVGRVSSFRFDLLDNDESLIGELTSVQSGDAQWSIYVAVKGAGKLEVTDKGVDIDWLNTRVRPTMILAPLGAREGERVERPVGLFLPAAPVEGWSSVGRSWSVELLDKLSILDQDIVTDAAGNPITFTAPVGSNVVSLVVTIIMDAGETAEAITPSDVVLPNPLVWDVGTSRLKIINDLLDAGGFFSLTCDGQGQYRVGPYLAPADRPPVYANPTPFSSGEFSLMSPDWSRDHDIAGIPNRYVVTSQGDGEVEAMVAVATNEDPASPYSFQRRGNRWLTATNTGVEATSLEVLQSMAQRGLAGMTAVTSGMTVTHPFLPDLSINSTVVFTTPDGRDVLCYVTKTSIPFSPVGLCTSEIMEAAL